MLKYIEEMKPTIKKREILGISPFILRRYAGSFQWWHYFKPAHFKNYFISVIFLVCVKLSPLNT